MKTRYNIFVLLLFFTALTVHAQHITIGGNIYGGGNAGQVDGNATVTVYGGDINRVFGGARMADVGGRAFVNVDGKNASDSIVINYIFGGNDVSGQIGMSDYLPTDLRDTTLNSIDNTWNVFVKISTDTLSGGAASENAVKVFVGQLFGGGNGDYTYRTDTVPPTTEDGDTVITYKVLDAQNNTIATSSTMFTKPDITKTYLEILGGSIGYVYGGGNNATALEKTVINVDNPSAVVNSILNGSVEVLTEERLRTKMGINTAFTHPESQNFQIDRLFGGNNKAEMSIRPTWNLRSGSIRDLYSGGNEGRMTSKEGLLLEIMESSRIVVDNVYGGCRKADVDPKENGVRVETVSSPAGYKFPNNLAARVIIRGGDINNVYGGNDISGKVYFGNAVGVYADIRGDIYGGGNGSYAYTDQESLKNSLLYGDFYYNPDSVLAASGVKATSEAMKSVQALNLFRPNAEQVSIRIKGFEDNTTIIGGSIYVGGNSATMKPKATQANPLLELKIGSYVIADKVFMGNNGENMVDSTENGVLAKYAGMVEGVDFSTLDLTVDSVFAEYMEGCAMSLRPSVVFDSKDNNDPDTYVDFTSYFGSFYCGGNVGSMTYKGTNTLNFNKPIYIYNKIVGGCNNAFVPASKYNAAYEGGILVALTEAEKTVTTNKLVMNFDGTLLVPKRLKADKTLEWNTKTWQVSSDSPALLVDAPAGTPAGSLRLDGGNIYGGCYESGIVNGDVEINIKDDVVHKDSVFGEGNSGVLLASQSNDVLGTALNVFGAGYGVQSKINGNTTINLQGGYAFHTYGGGEQGRVMGNCTTNLSSVAGHTAVVDKIYGGGLEGAIDGSVYVHLGRGTAGNVIGGSCNADIDGHVEVYVGDIGFPTVSGSVYGGNDFGGTINTLFDHADKINSTDDRDMVYARANTQAATYVEFIQGDVSSVFGGNKGAYDYKNQLYRKYTTADGLVKKDDFKKPHISNAFVQFSPSLTKESKVRNVYGGSQGYHAEEYNNKMQDRSYLLVNFTDSLDKTNKFISDSTQFFGAGDYAGIGMGIPAATALENTDSVTATAVVDLIHGNVRDVFGASYREGITRRTIVNVPDSSSVTVNRIFGGAYGLDIDNPCDVIEANVNWSSKKAIAEGAPEDVDTRGNQKAGGIYGGNNNARQTLFARVNINSKVTQNTIGYTGRIFGAGYGKDSWACYTEVNLNNGANVYEVYGGGYGGKVLNKASVQAWGVDTTIVEYSYPQVDSVASAVMKKAELDGKQYDANVHVYEGAYVGNYAYGGGLGADAVVSGTTYFDLLGGTVNKDVYGSGTSGDVRNLHEDKGSTTFIASTNVFIKGGSVRNVYGGGWRGSVGYHKDSLHMSNDYDILGESHVVIGTLEGTGFKDGVPAIKRNVYGGGEGGAIFGTAYVTVNNGRIGYRYNETDGQYIEELDDDGNDEVDNLLDEGGNVFGGGYVANSYTDTTVVNMYGGIVRGCLYGGGEIGPVGRGTVNPQKPAGSFVNEDAKIYKGGKTYVCLWKGHVLRDVFGGGRGFDNWNGEGYMTDEERLTMDLSSKGYVFGSTEVRIRGGEIGTRQGVNKGYGNVFGGGNVGFVYSASGVKKGKRTTIGMENLSNGLPLDGGGYYYSKWVEDRAECQLSLDCNVVVEPYCEVTSDSGITIDNFYSKGQFVPIEELCKLSDKETDAAQWSRIDWESGVTIHNAVFAGGNVIKGSDQVSVNTATVYGNVTAALRDAYNRDLITVGTEHVGGLYGDGNLTFVDGWRELHIDSYGTDYYNNDETITKEKYESMSDRERAYFVLNYRCINECTGKEGVITVGKRMTADEFKEAFDYDNYNDSTYTADYKNYINEDGTPNPAYFEELGFCSIYAGRLLNTIQRCDMAAVWGSRIVLQGARDRVPEKADYTRYTLNRVGELSLNQRKNPKDSSEKHENYFGIYSIVNYLGNLTSDVFFTETVEAGETTAIRKTNSSNSDNLADGVTTYYKWKMDHRNKSNRNNGISANKVSLASGVYLEIIREESEKTDHTEWGLITGVVQLDLIDVKTGQGGGYVYARNQHGKKVWHKDWDKVNLSPYNLEARTYKRFTYEEDPDSLMEIETSGNFVHNTKQIVDDCYPNANAYMGTEKSPAHYWYIKGSIYVYDQYISAYTGSANAYAKMVSIPLTISAASHGKMTLRDVQPNRYAYYGTDGRPLGDNGKAVINEITYQAGDPIDYWSYQSLGVSDQSLFVDSVYTTISKCLMTEEATENDTIIAGHIMLPGEYAVLRKQAQKKVVSSDDGAEAVPAVYDPEKQEWVAFDHVFRLANNIGHNTGYALTLDFNNPLEWDKYYSLNAGRGSDGKLSIPKIEYEDKKGTYHTDQSLYTTGPTYTPKESGVYAQRIYKLGEIISGEVHKNYDNHVKSRVTDRTDQAEVERAYVVTTEFAAVDKEGTERHFYAGSPLYESDFNPDLWNSLKTDKKVDSAMVCTSTLQITDKDYIFAGSLLSPDSIASLKTRVVAANLTTAAEADNFLHDYLSDAYYCTKGGLYGGNYFEAGKSYRAIDTWNSMSEDDRSHFLFNYDAFDLLIDPSYGGGYGNKFQYDGYKPGSTSDATIPQYKGCTPLSPKIYSQPQYVDFEAEYVGDEDLTYKDENDSLVTIKRGYENRISRVQFEDIPNERVHWSPIIVDSAGVFYVAKQAFIRGDVPYTVGQMIEKRVYNSLTGKERNEYIDELNFKGDEAGTKAAPKYYYFCREPYVIGERGEGVPITNEGITQTTQTYNVGDTVTQNILIVQSEFDKLVNKQTGFVIHGTAPEETATLYVSHESDIHDLQKEKIITVIYLYEYHESDESGNNITPVSERHIINLHINFESGVPEIGVLQKPTTILPGTTVGLKIPNVEPGAFEITSSGWEVFANADDAALHTNGQPFYNNASPLYWYQNGYYVAYYAQTYLGKTYSNAVQFSVANYHDLKKVMDDTRHHYYIDHKDVDREPKVYIGDYSQDNQNGLDMLRDLITLTHGKEVAGHEALSIDNSGKELRGGKYLKFFLQSNQEYSGNWDTPIANGTDECFSGVLHGDGYYISGLNKSLFGHLCGSVYNLGVTGSFTSAGVADTGDGYVENCWISTTGAPDGSVRAVFGDPTAESGIQVRNCYYPETLSYSTTDTNHTGLARPMPMKAFYNGEVTYNLNDFYLYKRYYDHTNVGEGAYTYKYWKNVTNQTTGATEQQLVEGKYHDDYSRFVYVEDRFQDGDFIYAGGSVPSSADVRQYLEEGSTTPQYYPLWPDDYIFFGQLLSYDYERSHQDVPSHINKLGDRILTTGNGNRVYRAPAYYRSKEMGVAHFNPHAVFAQTKKDDASVTAYKDMTAIDFTGYNDTAYKEGLSGGYFFRPLLDDDGLTYFHNVDLTQNLLVYTGTSAPASAATDQVVARSLSEPAFTETRDDYHTVDLNTHAVSGHHVRLSGSAYMSTGDHFLVDKQDFNAPISYRMAAGRRMWYQRTPDNYAGQYKDDSGNTVYDDKSGWESISLPFSVDMVTSQTKGELTHFYRVDSDNNTTADKGRKGHEYWLRQCTGISKATDGEGIAEATFTFPDADATAATKDYTNSFLWDRYYQYADGDRQDRNSDTYQQQYYKSKDDGYVQHYDGYPRQQAAVPYLLGLPGSRYYEFDLSGAFEAKFINTAQALEKVPRQVITFASAAATAEMPVTIGVSDDELADHRVSADGYHFYGNYLNIQAPEGHYVMNARGNGYDKITSATVGASRTVLPFRTYFSAAASPTRSIRFSNEQSQLYGEERPDISDESVGSLSFAVRNHVVSVTSSLRYATDVCIVNVGGLVLRTFTIQPGETVSVDVHVSGVYIIRADGGRLQRKLAVE